MEEGVIRRFRASSLRSILGWLALMLMLFVGIEWLKLPRLTIEPTVAPLVTSTFSNQVFKREPFHTAVGRVYPAVRGESMRRVVFGKDNFEVSDFDGFVVVQVESRVGGRNGNGSDVFRTSITHNYVMAQRLGYEFCLYIGPEQVRHPDESLATGYWMKVPFIYLALHQFPRAKGVLYLDSDSYFGNRSIETFLEAQEIDLENAPIVLSQEQSHWFRVLKSFDYPQLYDYPAVNSGTILFNPRHYASKHLVRQWLIDSTKTVSALEVYCRCITVDVRCAGAPRQNATVIQTLQKVYGLKHPGHFHKCAKDLRVRWGPLNESSVTVLPPSVKGLRFNVRAIKSSAEFDRVLELSKTRRLKDALRDKHCPSGIRSLSVKRHQPELDFLHKEWPGDQERLQFVLSGFIKHIHITVALADQWLFGEHSKHMDLSGCRRGRKCLAYHPCANGEIKISEAAKVFKAHAPTTWAMQFPGVNPKHIIQSVPTLYLGPEYTINWESW